ncbi:Na-Ca exchanger/integrin-beta4 [Diplonema papillatum]|nr:Na-Ca exchanger/integrin-beta4 [Diplonema papillatum]
MAARLIPVLSVMWVCADGASIALQKTGTTTSEVGDTVRIGLKASQQPTADLTIMLSSSAAGEGTLSVGHVVITPENWELVASVIVTGVADGVVDGPQTYNILVGPVVSSDGNFTAWSDTIQLTNTDENAYEVRFSARDNLKTDEASGAEAKFEVTLGSRPSADVSFSLTNTNEDYGTVVPDTISFTPAQWNTPQVVTVTPVPNDYAEPKDVVYDITTSLITSTDTDYSGMDPGKVTITAAGNDDEVGFDESPICKLVVSISETQVIENEDTETLTVQLTSKPLADVTVSLTVPNGQPGVMDPSTLTFTVATWDVVQSSTLKPVTTATIDCYATYYISLKATSTDPGYDGYEETDVAHAMTIDDTTGYCIHVFPLCLDVTEKDNSVVEFEVWATGADPIPSMTVPLSTSDDTEATVSPSSVTLAGSAKQKVRITAPDDQQDDGDQPFTITVGPSESSEAAASDLMGAEVTGSSIDSHTSRVHVATSAILVNEAGSTSGTTAFALSTIPYEDVTVNCEGRTMSNGPAPDFLVRMTLSAASFTFTAANWNVPQTLTLTAIDNLIDDNDKAYYIVCDGTSTDANYEGTRGIVKADVINDDTAGVTIVMDPSDTDPFELEEVGTTSVTAAVSLTSEPLGNVAVTFQLPETGIPYTGVLHEILQRELTVSAPNLTFTAANWDTPQTLTIMAADDSLADGLATLPCQFVVSTDDVAENTKYGTAAAAAYDDVKKVYTFTVADDDQAGVTVQAVDGSLPPFKTEEANAGGIVLTVALASEPMCGWSLDALTVGNVTELKMTVASSDGNEGVVTGVPAAGFTFTRGDWNVPKTFTVTGVDDESSDPSPLAPYTIDFEVTDSCYTPPIPYIATVPAPADAYLNHKVSVQMVNADNDVVGVFVKVNGLPETSEDGLSCVLTLSVGSQPVPSATITVTVSDANEASLSSASFTITQDDYKTPRTVTVEGVDDELADGDANYTVSFTATTSADAAYAALPVTEVKLVNRDNDKAGISMTPSHGISTHEGTGHPPAEVTVRLTAQPEQDISITQIKSNNTDEAVVVGPTEMLFTPGNWRTAQTVTVNGVDDDYDDGDAPFRITMELAASGDPVYAEFEGTHTVAEGLNIDDDQVGITIFPASGLVTTEPGGSDTFTVTLSAKPSGSVSFDVFSSDTSEGLVTPTSLSFSVAGWDVPATLTVTGVDDDFYDRDQLYTVRFTNVASSDPEYAGYKFEKYVMVMNMDNDTSPCKNFGGQCADEACDVCCSATCGVECSPFDCTDEEDECCGRTIEKNVKGGFGLCYETLQAPCVVHKVPTPCDAYGGVCSDNTCTTCCELSCGDLCGAPNCADGGASKCCPDVIGKNATACSMAAGAPCQRPNPCGAFGGICRDATCSECCAGTCGACGGTACAEGDACCDAKISGGQLCGAGATAPCVRVDKCTEYGGVCGDDDCSSCCTAGCPSCTTTVEGVSCMSSAAEECCPLAISYNARFCGPNTPAPCLRVSKCKAYDGICKDEACTVCCIAGTCGSCGHGHCNPNAIRPFDDECCDVDIVQVKDYCSDTVSAPCIRIDKCARYGGICADEACATCCPKSCGECSKAEDGIDQACAGSKSQSCCEQNLLQSAPSCSESGTAPCVRSAACAPFGGICEDDACEACCAATCTRCGGELCELEGTASECCPEAILASSPVCDDAASAPCVRVNKCEAQGGVCNDESCTACCDAGCEYCGGPMCVWDELGRDKCCPETFANSCAAAGAPCVRSDAAEKCAPFGGRCKDEDCVVCCDARCGTCGGNLCDEDPLGAELCCPSAILRAGAKPCTGNAAPCIRVETCEPMGGVCNDAACSTCCAKGCGVCGGRDCESDPLSQDKCCPDAILGVQPMCDDGNAAPCTRFAPDNDDADDEEFPGWAVALIVLLLLSVVCLIVFMMWRSKKSKGGNDDDDDDGFKKYRKASDGEDHEEMATTIVKEDDIFSEREPQLSIQSPVSETQERSTPPSFPSTTKRDDHHLGSSIGALNRSTTSTGSHMAPRTPTSPLTPGGRTAPPRRGRRGAPSAAKAPPAAVPIAAAAAEIDESAEI